MEIVLKMQQLNRWIDVEMSADRKESIHCHFSLKQYENVERPQDVPATAGVCFQAEPRVKSSRDETGGRPV